MTAETHIRPDSLSNGTGFYRNASNELCCEDTLLSDIAHRWGTPTYVYSRAAITERWNAYETAFGTAPHQICYAVKAASTKGILEVLAALGAGFDCVSGGEILRVLAAGGDPKKIVFSGVAKTPADIAFALTAGIKCFNIESPAELDRIANTARNLGLKAHISVRVNPNIDAHVDHHVATGLGDSKFGVKLTDVIALYQKAAELKEIEIEGISCHIGSLVESTAPYMSEIEVLSVFVNELLDRGIALKHFDIGGGAGVAYKADEKTLEPSELIPAVVAQIRSLVKIPDIEILIGPGRSIIAQAGVLLTRVEYLKSGLFERNFCVVDASMTELVRPAMYGSHHEIEPVSPRSDIEAERLNIVGGVCESSDILGSDRELAVAPGDLLAIRTAGAYGMSMASTYNSRPLPMEVLVDGAVIRPLRRRMTALDLLSDEYDLGLGQACIPADEVKKLFTQAQTYSEPAEDHDNK